MPQRLADAWLERLKIPGDKPMAECKDAALNQLAEQLQRWQLAPNGSEGWRKAEVMRGGVDTRDVLTGQDGVGQAVEDLGHPPPHVVGDYPISPSRHGVAPSGLDHTARGPEVIRPRIAVG